MSAVFEALGEARRRQILQVLAHGERSVGAIVDALRVTAPTAQPTVSQHLRVLRDAGLVTVRADGTRRYYALDPSGLAAARTWLERLGDPLRTLTQPLDALATEVARGARERRRATTPQPSETRQTA